MTTRTCSIVGEADLQAIAGELVGVGSANDNIASDGGVCDLADDVAASLRRGRQGRKEGGTRNNCTIS